MDAVSRIASAIGEPARARMLFALMDGRARTSTELAALADITASTASAHLHRLVTESLLTVLAQGRSRYYSLNGPSVGAALEALSIVAGTTRDEYVPKTPLRLRTARTCYDHIAGALGVALCDRMIEKHWIADDCDVTDAGAKALHATGIDIEVARKRRRRFAFPCLDWSERRPHVGGALGAAILDLALKHRWVQQDSDSRALTVTAAGRREFSRRFDIHD